MCAKVTTIWEVRPEPKRKKSIQSKMFFVAGKASGLSIFV